MDDIQYENNTNKMHTVERVFIYKTHPTCSGHSCGYLQGDDTKA